ncbi:MAG TPA: tryptophan synthase subunit alpha [bacterium]|nr:tryptophan synthase subunit alpha [bacterium]
MSRIGIAFRRLKKNGEKALIPFLTAGDPNPAATKRLIFALERAGADVIELGVPFSDPMADGPVIQKASERALAKGMTLRKVLELVARIRKVSQVPLLLMGYFNPILSYGLDRFARDAARAGVDGAIVVDLPPEESKDLDRALKKSGIDLIYLLTPTSDAERIRIVCRRARGFLYFVSMTGVTGAALKSVAEIRAKVSEIRRRTKLPVAIGFGISSPKQARAMAKIGDGAVVGSALVALVHKNAKNPSAKAEAFIKTMRGAL